MNKVYSADGTVIAYEAQGSGPAVVLVGGAFMTRADSGELASRLAERFTVITYDRRGRGDSGDAPIYDVQREIEDLDALIAHAGGEAMVFGMSSGAVLALEATARGSAVTRLALYEPPFITDAGRPPLPADYVAHLENLVTRGAYGDAVAYFMTAAVGMPPEAVAGMRQAPFWAAMEATARTLPYDGRVMGDTMSGRPLPADRWQSVTIPVLVGSGDAGAPHMLTGARELASLAENFSLHTFPGQEHDIDPALLAPVLTEFFTAGART
ncbi:alpha/beta hydrolase [Streptomyces sp. WAC05374]|uniref:alpha/beta fold hydrolase n=1 Tax=Streptomyces sp. WAC05374 TaxID=2487420 RepID=UPI000F87F363|nr:alpha/beta hydrolase [Streptomyces sp. WAC05374]RST15015.1 alpha/beta hydrolase [Streptomyces sp. WAC05374]TDF54722.1 alpha/beta hydrolase [Streptomyces sp. WAC05374]TDF56358.1 alpha/beta hydrolase [Streptomyces sp. WAC05374]